MLLRLKWFASLLKWPLRPLVRFKVLPDDPITELQLDRSQPIFYICHTESASDLATLRRVCQQLELPDPLQPVTCAGQKLDRILFLERPHQLIGGRSKTTALQQGQQLLQLHSQQPELNAQLIPAAILWGRAPGKENSIKWLIGEAHSPNWLAKLLIILISGRHTMIRLSKPVALQQMATQFGHGPLIARKLLRMSRIHFYRQRLAATGPRLMNRNQLHHALLARSALKKAIADEAKTHSITKAAARQRVRKLVLEIAADYRESTLRVGDRVLSWLWNKLYHGLSINHSKQLQELAQKGHEIVYVPCHRSHMDYLLLSYVIYHQGLVPPHIAAGINLNFWPAGPIFRRGGAFFIRRSFSGNKLYSTVFREYLSLLFSKGYAVKYYPEGGRSRTGRLLTPKTGMLAMTVQALLRGIDRPITLVPVYLGYEHVMEVDTYLKELKGSAKQKESAFGVFKAMRKLRNYGFGYINFGEPIALNSFMTERVPDWKRLRDESEAHKPAWLGTVVDELATTIMVHINQAAALNSINLIALVLLATRHKALARPELEQQIQLYLDLQQQLPYHSRVTSPEQTPSQLVEHALKLEKITQSHDHFGDIIELDLQQSILLSYYRNNVIHLFMMPAILASALLRQRHLTKVQLIATVQQLFPLLAAELYLQPTSLPEQMIDQLLDFMAKHQLVELSDEGVQTVSQQQSGYRMLGLLAGISTDTLQRYAIVLNLLQSSCTQSFQQISRATLEQQSQALAARLLTLHGITAPEYLDKQLFATLIRALRQQNYLQASEDGQLAPSAQIKVLTTTVNSLLHADVLQSIQALVRTHISHDTESKK
ncbi:glycerol-3-phosphate 1-O-acyltransferase PlsB [Alkalimonas collagenimarina]|uniref:Glycerol-3-phosphate acyltransferase n=1 Tax=Alkalimonas collagenimarina TaxID=400390 RepID=A0ABT9GX65_9GAMM|nr:glycerol-3-phosphate 1-O-acyltransferase PlsB [Alkalimonas collagenimarina]MDP4535649.1 glycerol-3-phosphate 1-O-acyltransferase PlsB [Alkalimonas collagenimarina]